MIKFVFFHENVILVLNTFESDGYKVSVYSNGEEHGVETFSVSEGELAKHAYEVRSCFIKPELISSEIKKVRGYDYGNTSIKR